MIKRSQKLKFEAYILVLVVAHLLGAFLLRDYFTVNPKLSDEQTKMNDPIVGAKINLPDWDWSRHPQTLILTLQKDCHSSNESSLFYKRVIETVAEKNVKLVAVFPTEKEESIIHLYNLGLTGMEVRQSPLSSLRVAGTPTLILIDDKGRITDFWSGRLSAEKETEVINKLKL